MANNSKESYNLSKIEEENLRQAIRELMLNALTSEHDALYPKATAWKDETTKLRSDMMQLLKNIEDDQYEDGLESIDRVISKLRTWKTKIQKFLN